MTASMITCPAGVYTALTASATSATVRVKTMNDATTQVRIGNAASAPAAGTTDYTQISDKKPKEFEVFTNNLYAMPIGSNAVIEVNSNA